MAKPRLTFTEALVIIQDKGLDLEKYKVIVLGLRGYYKNTFGKPFENDRNFYDDAMFVVSVDFFKSYNANVDPSRYRKGIASLIAGVYTLVKWRHKGKYDAFQIINDRLLRDGSNQIDAGRHGINFHYGGDNDTWSEGCQTFPKAEFEEFRADLTAQMKKHHLTEITYLLTEEF